MQIVEEASCWARLAFLYQVIGLEKEILQRTSRTSPKEIFKRADFMTGSIQIRPKKYSSARERRADLVQIILANPKTFSTQDQLATILGVTQPTVFKDIKKEKLEKDTDGFYVVGEERQNQKRRDILEQLLKYEVTGILDRVYFGALETRPESGHAVAQALKLAMGSEVLGVISGDGVVLIAFGDDEQRRQVMKTLKKTKEKRNRLGGGQVDSEKTT